MSTDSISRRRFLSTAGVGIAAVAGAGALAACSPSEQGGQTAAEVSPSQISWADEYDVVIVGSGAAGFATALSVLQNDASATVAILESLPQIGGNSGLSRGNYGAVGTDIQIEAGKTDEAFKDDSPDLYFAEKCALGDYRMDTKLTRIFVDKCLDGYHWLNDIGVTFQKVGMYDEPVPEPENAAGLKLRMSFNPIFTDGTFIGPQTKGRHHKSAAYKDQTGGMAAIHAMQDAADALGSLTVLTETKMTSLVRDIAGSGEVMGVYVSEQGKETKAIQAKRAVVITAGGYSANPEMIAKYDPRIPVETTNTGCSGVDGEALIATQDIGADVRGMDFIQPTFELSGADRTQAPLFLKRGEYINVDSTGNRFWKEMESKASFRDGRVTLLHELGFTQWWSIADSAAAERLKLDDDMLQTGIDKGITIKADTIDELASIIGVPGDAIQASLDRYNGFVDAGSDEDFGQEKRYLHRIDTPPFYAESRAYYVHSTPGGLCVNENTEVIDRHGEVIPRLYAAGEVTGGLHGTERNGGCSWTECIVFGIIAGEHAAAL